jgi:hypothetical protein
VVFPSGSSSSVSHMCYTCGTTCLQHLAAARLALAVALTCAQHMGMLVRCVDVPERPVQWCVWVPAAGSFDCNPAACFVAFSGSASSTSVTYMYHVCGTTCLQRLTAARLALVVALTCAQHMGMLVRCVDQQERPVQWCVWVPAAGSFDCNATACFVVISGSASSTSVSHICHFVRDHLQPIAWQLQG